MSFEQSPQRPRSTPDDPRQAQIARLHEQLRTNTDLINRMQQEILMLQSMFQQPSSPRYAHPSRAPRVQRTPGMMPFSPLLSQFGLMPQAMPGMPGMPRMHGWRGRMGGIPQRYREEFGYAPVVWSNRRPNIGDCRTRYESGVINWIQCTGFDPRTGRAQWRVMEDGETGYVPGRGGNFRVHRRTIDDMRAGRSTLEPLPPGTRAEPTVWQEVPSDVPQDDVERAQNIEGRYAKLRKDLYQRNLGEWDRFFKDGHEALRDKPLSELKPVVTKMFYDPATQAKVFNLVQVGEWITALEDSYATVVRSINADTNALARFPADGSGRLWAFLPKIREKRDNLLSRLDEVVTSFEERAKQQTPSRKP